ncbi:Six-hairpin glycosidase-like protein [Emericellopsis atlantica]|uniref:Six-hairpin glycosidase-like protein n=1 Tax=Emericellopsis atlantica TaxID=2614577 RepID=A0A9P7ZRT1_9HYPO|nr:Six-hairpin glycosidase-like protein [Emericellopsis atlantica]KAG9256931.1 Six-hairpin glycosidase-like protein [Emericellopsis atlantica]
MGSISPTNCLESEALPQTKGYGLQGTHDYSRPVIFDLEARAPSKTVDIGRDGTSLSTDLVGRVLQLGVFHPKHGIVVAVPFEQFDGSRFHDPAYVRDYRTRMLTCLRDRTPGFGLDLGQPSSLVSVRMATWNRAVFEFSLGRGLHVVHTAQILRGGELVQSATVTNRGAERENVRARLNLGLSLNRASYGQLTEGGPIPLPPSQNDLVRTNGGCGFRVTNPCLGARLDGFLEVDGVAVALDGLDEQLVRERPLHATHFEAVSIAPGCSASLVARYRLLPEAQSDEAWLPLPIKQAKDTGHVEWKRAETIGTYIIRRNVDYVLANCVVPISDTASAVITDHVALPLGWNRDNYWQIRLLYKVYKNLPSLVNPPAAEMYRQHVAQATKAHLRWVFVEAQRPHGFWHRSYLVTGLPKDGLVFQLDQQCYPILELCDFLECFPHESGFVLEVVEGGALAEVLGLVSSKQDPGCELWPTDETPGDDAVVYPFHFSSHVLLWHTLSRLRGLLSQLGVGALDEMTGGLDLDLDLDDLIKSLRERTMEHFTAIHPGSGLRMFAYLTDGGGRHTFYHDGNDVPTLLAQDWGFVVNGEETELWRNTMEFGLSPANETGYCSKGPYHGLGSVHTTGTWTLGLFHEAAYAAAQGDADRLADVWRRIAGAMQWDGTFSEAIDHETAVCSSKAWFSWPGSMIGAWVVDMRATDASCLY